MTASAERLIWVDMEMTGLDPEACRIIEVAAIVTDNQLNVIAEAPVLAIHQSEAVLAAMDEWCTRTHGASGLMARVQASTIDEAAAEAQLIAFLSQHVTPGSSPMCGNSIGQDRRFMARYMPQLERFFHYRNLDVSTLKELCRRWRPELMAGLHKQGTHLALDDIRESIAELRYYREHFLKAPEA